MPSVIVLHQGRIRRHGPATSVIEDAGATGLQDAFERLIRVPA